MANRRQKAALGNLNAVIEFLGRRKCCPKLGDFAIIAKKSDKHGVVFFVARQFDGKRTVGRRPVRHRQSQPQLHLAMSGIIAQIGECAKQAYPVGHVNTLEKAGPGQKIRIDAQHLARRHVEIEQIAIGAKPKRKPACLGIGKRPCLRRARGRQDAGPRQDDAGIGERDQPMPDRGLRAFERAFCRQ